MATTGVLACSVVLQLLAAASALRLIPVTRGAGAWILIASATLLMAVRRSITLVERLSSVAHPSDAHLSTELVALLISAAMLAGILLIRPLFQRVVESEQATAEEKERLRVTLGSIAAGVIATDTEGRVVLFNAAAAALTGLTPEHALGRSLPELVTLTPSGAMESALAGEAPNSEHLVSLVSEDGEERPLRLLVAAIRAAEGAQVGNIVVLHDRADELRAEREHRRVERLEALGLLAGGIAHDFNNLLTTILGNISLARLDATTGEVDELLSESEEGCVRAAELVRQLLTFSRSGAPIKKASSLDDLIRQTTEFSLRGTGVEPRFRFASDASPAFVDVAQMSQVISNLALNASQAMRGTGVFELSLDNAKLDASNPFGLPPGDYVRVEARDHGPGIPAEDLPHVFDPYFTTKETGTGLGLATVHSVVRQHGGHVTATSVGDGALFTVYLPAAQTPALPEDEPSAATPGARGRPLRVLLMDDEPQLRTIGARVLETFGHEVVVVADGEKAIESYRDATRADRPFDVVVLDLTIPGGLGGRATLERLLTIDPDVRAVVCSGYSGDSLVSDFADHGFVAAIAKPYSAEDLRRGVEAAALPMGSEHAASDGASSAG